MKPEYLMLGHTFKPAKYNIAGWFLSEKLDGMRAYWDGGLSRGILASEVPYANKVKDYRLKVAPTATGLWSRTGKVIHAPHWWLDDLPNLPLDGELWMGRGCFQKLTSTVSRYDGGSVWEHVKYCVFDSPPFNTMLQYRTIKVRDYEFEINNGINWYLDQLVGRIKSASDKWPFSTTQIWLKNQQLGSRVILINQEQLSFSHWMAVMQVEQRLKDLLLVGAEGVVLRKHSSFWVPERSHTLLKYKPWQDDEAVITGFTTGRKTDKGSRLLGKIGALIVDYKGKRLELSGLTDAEREFADDWSKQYATDNPGEDMPGAVHAVNFRIGQTITFKYRELSDDGVPKEARYWRKR